MHNRNQALPLADPRIRRQNQGLSYSYVLKDSNQQPDKELRQGRGTMDDTDGKPVAFLDTNSINSSSLDTLFGNADDLAKLEPLAHIVLPSVVFDELIEHKKRHFDQERQKLMKNHLLPSLSGSREKLQELTFESYEKAMKGSSSIKYEVVDIQDREAAMAHMYDPAIHNKAPFEENSDKGFKDAWVVMTVDEYLERHPEYDRALLITNDNRMAEHFDSETNRVKVVPNIKEALKALSLSRKDETGARAIVSQSCTSQNNESSSPEDNISNAGQAKDLINDLNNSRSFAETHTVIARFNNIDTKSLSPREGRMILEACVTNDQVSYILPDKDVDSFIRPIFLQFQQDLGNDAYSMFVDALGLPNERHDASGHVMLSRSERDAYNDFVQGLMSNIRSRDFDSSITTDATAIEDGLDRLIALEAIDEHAVSWRDVALVFVKDGVTASSSIVKAGILQNFLSLLQHGSDEKEKAKINAIAFRLEEVDLDIPF